MTNEEAIQFLKNMKGEEAGRAIGKEGFYAELLGYHIEALDTAIEALKDERAKGEWIMNKTSARGRNYTCTICKKVSRNKFDFCPNCGADMREADNDYTKT